MSNDNGKCAGCAENKLAESSRALRESVAIVPYGRGIEANVPLSMTSREVLENMLELPSGVDGGQASANAGAPYEAPRVAEPITVSTIREVIPTPLAQMQMPRAARHIMLVPGGSDVCGYDIVQFQVAPKEAPKPSDKTKKPKNDKESEKADDWWDEEGQTAEGTEGNPEAVDPDKDHVQGLGVETKDKDGKPTGGFDMKLRYRVGKKRIESMLKALGKACDEYCFSFFQCFKTDLQFSGAQPKKPCTLKAANGVEYKLGDWTQDPPPDEKIIAKKDEDKDPKDANYPGGNEGSGTGACSKKFASSGDHPDIGGPGYWLACANQADRDKVKKIVIGVEFETTVILWCDKKPIGIVGYYAWSYVATFIYSDAAKRWSEARLYIPKHKWDWKPGKKGHLCWQSVLPKEFKELPVIPA